MRMIAIAIVLLASGCLSEDVVGDADVEAGECSSAELCDGVDNDCDEETYDGDDEEWVGQPCGPGEPIGVTYCVRGLVVCAPQ